METTEQANDPAAKEAANTARIKVGRTLEELYKAACTAVRTRQRKAQEQPNKAPKRAENCCKRYTRLISVALTPSVVNAVHFPSWQTIGTLHQARLYLLHAACRTGASEEEAGFEAAVTGLLLQEHAKKTQTFALPSDLLRAFTAGLHLETELCVSALTFQRELANYYSERAEDAAFGVSPNF